MKINKAAWLAVGVVAVTLAYFFLLPLIQPLLFDDEDRPPIIVQEGSLKFIIDNAVHGTTAKWKDKGSNKKWQPRQTQAKNAVSFTVTNEGTGGTCNLTGTRGEIAYAIGGSTFTYQVSLDTDTPGRKAIVIDTPESPSSTADEVLAFHSTLEGAITQVLVEGSAPCNFNDDASPKLTFRFNY